jgi:hypothetical protein
VLCVVVCVTKTYLLLPGCPAVHPSLLTASLRPPHMCLPAHGSSRGTHHHSQQADGEQESEEIDVGAEVTKLFGCEFCVRASPHLTLPSISTKPSTHQLAHLVELPSHYSSSNP